MNEINEEIKLTLNLMSSDIDDGAHDELQNHLYSLLEMKRNELQQRLVECKIEYVAQDPMPCKRTKPLTAEELMEGGWWCADVSEECAIAFKSKGLRVFNSSAWGCDEALTSGWIPTYGGVVRGVFVFRDGKQVHRIGNEFYWAEEIEID